MYRRVTTQDISWFLDLYRNKQLDLNPPFQRRSVWSAKDRKFFLDTIFRGFPSPSIFLDKSVVDGKTKYSVVDGKQRLETIIKFVNNNLFIDRKYGNIRLDNKKWKHLQSEEDIDLRKAFWDYVIPVEFINVTETGATVNDVFDRLNRNSRKLVDQELRHAKYDGWFITFVENESENSDWKDLKITTTARAKRMKDVQFLSELLIIILMKDVCGFNQENIDYYYATFDDLNEDDSEHDFSEDDIGTIFSLTKTYLRDCEREHEIITKYAKDFKNFYSLWAVVSLNSNRLLPIDEFALKYSNFMNDVEKFKNDKFLEKFSKRENITELQTNYRYHIANSGASTEEPQRKERHEILQNTIFGDSILDENSTND